jgi:tetratricopeptide (TPR) repeat protein
MTALTPDRTCEEYSTPINDYVDGTLPASERAALEAHLASCAACERTVADLSQMRRAAQSLPPRRPRADAWRQISDALRAEMDAEPRRSSVLVAHAWTRNRVALAAAAILVLAVTSTVWLVRQPPAPGAPQQAAAPSPAPAATPAAAVNPAQSDLVKNIDEELKAAESHYEKAITGLEQIAKSDPAALDPALAATLQTNLGVIDRAIRDSRAAIQAQPTNQFAQDSLFEALQRKVSLLEDTVALINAMRKGDQAGTAKIVQGLNKT